MRLSGLCCVACRLCCHFLSSKQAPVKALPKDSLAMRSRAYRHLTHQGASAHDCTRQEHSMSSMHAGAEGLQ